MTLRIEPCRAEKSDCVICQRELGHPGPHVHRSGRRGLGDPVVRWFSAVAHMGPVSAQTPTDGTSGAENGIPASRIVSPA